jgi:type-F conjugative transfer system pilin assembly protein TrbC
MDCLQEATLLYLLRLTIALLLSTLPAAADELEESVQRAIERARKDAAKIDIPVNKHWNAGMNAAQESARVFNSTQFQEKIQCEQQRLREEVFSDYAPDTMEQNVSIPGKLAEDESVYLFFSSSMPDETINAYLTAMEKFKEPEITVLMKGLVPGERHRYLIRIAQKDLSCADRIQQENPVICDRFQIPIRIQPSLFEQYEVSEVPAVVYERKGFAWKITGDAGLDYLLEQINQEAKSPSLSRLVTTLQRMRHE